MPSSTGLEIDDYRALSAFRYGIRKFQRFSEAAARAAGLEPQQHQLLLAVKGLPEGLRATIGELAERMQTQHHSTVELIDRLAEQGLVQRKRSEEDRRQVLVLLTAHGERLLRELSIHHREELQAIGPELIAALRTAIGPGRRRTTQGTGSGRQRGPGSQRRGATTAARPR